jgi:hypothetical protein
MPLGHERHLTAGLCRRVCRIDDTFRLDSASISMVETAAAAVVAVAHQRLSSAGGVDIPCDQIDFALALSVALDLRHAQLPGHICLHVCTQTLPPRTSAPACSCTSSTPTQWRFNARQFLLALVAKSKPTPGTKNVPSSKRQRQKRGSTALDEPGSVNAWALPQHMRIPAAHDLVAIFGRQVHFAVERRGPVQCRRIVMRVRDDESRNTAEIVDGLHGSIVEVRDAVPQQVAVLGTQQQRTLTDGHLWGSADADDARVVFVGHKNVLLRLRGAASRAALFRMG